MSTRVEAAKARLAAANEERDAAQAELQSAEDAESWSVLVGNIGTVYYGPEQIVAALHFNTYVEQSKQNTGRAAGEDVTLMRGGEIEDEYVGWLCRANDAQERAAEMQSEDWKEDL